MSWKPLIYKDMSYSGSFEYSSEGLIRNIKTKKIYKQTNDNVVINVDGYSVRINIPFLLTGKYNRENSFRKDKGVKRKTVITEKSLDKRIERIVDRKIAKYMETRYPVS